MKISNGVNQILILNPPFILRHSLSLKWKLSLKIFWILLFVSVISLLVLYIFQVSSLTGENYLLKNQERKLTEIKKEKEILEINFSKANSLANIENYFQNQNFEKANQVKYIQILESSVVAK
ncbi:MAG: hypothetical protein COX89_00380 [Candidatus Nealsonbacteria bacterium CG_4_10_14_0_2_um_filter_37_10]|uniref:Uncharacterized protein n=3 Tax=Candidatus Nealsoniibacteriota TaxID=1817911 RepID=A0A2M7V0B0_9BACT|nr:MAG: hypothetical protein COU43_01635 [Candidatus Nealsonbacteria bacterium CG10_big_fil_rev_8_21_14_0_10_37_25]PIZ89651.1 MAG: hypothetical protein COX89_00380 [Candidatus Nealsonbacteria bacterium CG_4_10_14_0_2_um_filter_37_10]PJA84097.1 MAG: hypothetical protein CO145_02385 [Candidatus Nealsonbacteria bacterium CG_4_9_14_3_um_filter_37_13]